MYKLFFHSVVFVLISFQAFAGKSDSLRYFFKASAIAGYGFETFRYNGSQSYTTSYRRDNYGYNGSVKKSLSIAQKYGVEIKFDCELPLGIKFVNGISYNIISYDVPEYNGSYKSLERTEIVYTYKVKEKIKLETAHVFFGLGYGRKTKRIIWDVDLSADFYNMRSLTFNRSIAIEGNPGVSNVPSGFVSILSKDLRAYGPLLGIKGSANISYKLVKCLYVKAGLVYWHGAGERRFEGSYGYEYIRTNFNAIQSFMLNVGFSLSVK